MNKTPLDSTALFKELFLNRYARFVHRRNIQQTFAMELFNTRNDQSAELVKEISRLRTPNYKLRNHTGLTEPVKSLTTNFLQKCAYHTYHRGLNGFCLCSVKYKVQSSIIQAFCEYGKGFQVKRRY